MDQTVVGAAAQIWSLMYVVWVKWGDLTEVLSHILGRFTAVKGAV